MFRYLSLITVCSLCVFGCADEEIKRTIDFKHPVISMEEDSTVSVTITSNALIASKDTIYLVISGGTATFGEDFTTNIPLERDTLKVFGTNKNETEFTLHAVFDTRSEGDEFVEFQVVKFSNGLRNGLHKTVRLDIFDKEYHTVEFAESAITMAEGNEREVVVNASRVLTASDTIYLSADMGMMSESDLAAGSFSGEQFYVVGNNTTHISTNLAALHDCAFEDSESLSVTITGASKGLAVGMQNALDIVIEDYESGNRCVSFDGVDDLINLGNIYDDLQFPLTIEAWVFVDAGQQYAYPVFTSQDNLALYNGFTFVAGPNTIAIEYGDGRGENNAAYRKGKSANVNTIANTWVHVAGIIRGPFDMELYLNGVNVGGTYSGSSSEPMDSFFPDDVAKIGHWYSNGITSRFKGKLDEIRVWERALTRTEIASRMCGDLNGDEAGLIGYWSFDETSGDIVYDKSQNAFNGTLVGSPLRTTRLAQ